MEVIGLPVLHMVYMLLVSAELLSMLLPEVVDDDEVEGAMLQAEDDSVDDEGVLQEGEPRELLVGGIGPPLWGPPGPIGPPPALIGRLGWPGPMEPL